MVPFPVGLMEAFDGLIVVSVSCVGFCNGILSGIFGMPFGPGILEVWPANLIALSVVFGGNAGLGGTGGDFSASVVPGATVLEEVTGCMGAIALHISVKSCITLKRLALCGFHCRSKRVCTLPSGSTDSLVTNCRSLPSSSKSINNKGFAMGYDSGIQISTGTSSPCSICMPPYRQSSNRGEPSSSVKTLVLGRKFLNSVNVCTAS